MQPGPDWFRPVPRGAEFFKDLLGFGAGRLRHLNSKGQI